MKLLVHVCQFPAESAMVNTFAAALRQHSADAAFSRMEARRIAAMAWRKERQVRRVPGPPVPPPHAPAATPPSRPAQILAALNGGGAAGAPASRGAPGHRCPPGDRRQCAPWPGAYEEAGDDAAAGLFLPAMVGFTRIAGLLWD